MASAGLARFPRRILTRRARGGLILPAFPRDDDEAAVAVAANLLFGLTTNVVPVSVAENMGAEESLESEQYRDVRDALVVQDAASYTWGPIFADTIRASDAAVATGVLLAIVADNARIQDSVLVVWEIAASDAIQGADSVDVLRTRLAVLVDAVRASDSQLTQLQALVAVVVGAALSDSADNGYFVAVADTAGLAESISATLAVLGSVADTITVADGAAGAIRITALVEDAVGVADAGATNLTAYQALVDGLRIAVTLRIDEAVYYAYVLHPQPVDKAGTRPVTQYQNYPFNSFARLRHGRRREYAAGPGGIYRLEGADDAGTPIDAWMTLAMQNFGGGRLSRLPEVFLAVRADDNAVFLKVVHIDPRTNRKLEDWYDLEAGPDGDNLRNNQVRLQQGLKAVWWQPTLRNKGGAPFDVASLTLYPVVLDTQ